MVRSCTCYLFPFQSSQCLVLIRLSASCSKPSWHDDAWCGWVTAQNYPPVHSYGKWLIYRWSMLKWRRMLANLPSTLRCLLQILSPSPSIHTCLHKSSCPRMGEVPTIAFPQQSTTKHWHDGACQVSNSLETIPFSSLLKRKSHP